MKPIIGIVTKNITVEEFYNWSWQRSSNDVRYAINKNGGIALGIMPQTKRKKFNQEDEPENVKLSNKEISDLKTILNKCDGIVLQGGYHRITMKSLLQDIVMKIMFLCLGYVQGIIIL